MLEKTLIIGNKLKGRGVSTASPGYKLAPPLTFGSGHIDNYCDEFGIHVLATYNIFHFSLSKG